MENKTYEVKFKQEDFNKLKQLNRVEFRQKEDRIKERFNYSFILLADGLFVFTLAFFCLFFISAYGKIDNVILFGLFGIFRYIMILEFVIMCGAIFLDLVSHHRMKKEIRRLQDEYFKIKIEVK